MKMMFHLWVHYCAAHGNLEHGVFVSALVVVSQGEGLWGCCDPRLDTGMSGGHPFVSNNSNQFFDILLCFSYVFLKKSQIFLRNSLMNFSRVCLPKTWVWGVFHTILV